MHNRKLEASKIIETTQFIVPYAKSMEQIYFRLAILIFCLMQQCIEENPNKSQSYKIYQTFILLGPGCSKLTTSLVTILLRGRWVIKHEHAIINRGSYTSIIRNDHECKILFITWPCKMGFYRLQNEHYFNERTHVNLERFQWRYVYAQKCYYTCGRTTFYDMTLSTE